MEARYRRVSPGSLVTEVDLAESAYRVRPDGHVILATFAPGGSEQRFTWVPIVRTDPPAG